MRSKIQFMNTLQRFVRKGHLAPVLIFVLDVAALLPLVTAGLAFERISGIVGEPCFA